MARGKGNFGGKKAPPFKKGGAPRSPFKGRAPGGGKGTKGARRSSGGYK